MLITFAVHFVFILILLKINEKEDIFKNGVYFFIFSF